jgi:hypothetical protein
LDPNVDPDSLCPFCDEPLPEEPTALFKKFLESVKKQATRDSRPTNPRGLKAPIGAFAELCQRHRFESKLLPLAKEKKWPVNIRWEDLEGRIRAMENDLTALVLDRSPEDDNDVELIREDEVSGPRSRCTFWKEAVKDVKQRGANVVAGVRGQFETFEKTQPG